MSLSDLAAIGSFISGIAVVISFLFLALQMRQTNRNQKSLMQQQRSARNVDILLRMSDCYMSETIAEADKNLAELEPARLWAYYGFAAAVFWSYEDSFLQFESNTLDAKSWTSDVATLRRLLANPSYRVVWKMARDGMSGRYRDYLDTVMEDVKGTPTRHLTDVFKIYVAEEFPAAVAQSI